MGTVNADVKILGVIDEDPFDFRTWSGSSRYLFQSLREKGNLCGAVSAQPSKYISTIYKLLSFYPNMAHWKTRYHLNVGYFKQMTKVAQNKIEGFSRDEYNVILQVGAWYDLAGRKGKRTVSYHDGNLYSLLSSDRNGHLKDKRFVKKCFTHEKVLYHKMDLLFTMSDWLRDKFCEGFDLHPDKVVTVGAGTNLPYTLEVDNKNYDRRRVLFVGKAFERKGGNVLLNAFQEVRRELPDAELIIIGPHLAAVPDGVTCLGYLSKDKDTDTLLNEYSKATLFVMPSLYEPFGIVFAEAMAHKLPCIGTRNCAMPELIKDGETGYLVPVGDYRKLSERIIYILKHPGKARELGENGFKHYQENYTWDRVTNKIVDAIRARLL
ncbi:MAG: glycosyltransferase family 4 protein [Syntrophales bacterium]|nr:glycosyltransferase family 4 protein [Syntrophales bacterium]